MRAGFTRRTAWTSAAAFLAFLGIAGLGFLVALRAADAFGLGPTARGLLLAGFGASGVVSGRPAGALVDRLGPVRVASAGAPLAAAVLPLLGVVGRAALLAPGWGTAGAGSAIGWAGLDHPWVPTTPANPR